MTDITTMPPIEAEETQSLPDPSLSLSACTSLTAPHQIEQELEDLIDAFALWDRADRATAYIARHVLARAYALLPEIETDPSARAVLERRVKAIPGLKATKAWCPEDRPAAELLVIMMIGQLGKLRGKKHQWWKALEAAQLSGIRHTEGAFIDFLEREGGIDGASKLFRPARPENAVQEMIKRFATLVPDDVSTFLAPDPLGTRQPFEEFGLVIVYGSHAGGPVVPVASLTDPKLTLKAIETLLKEIDKTVESS